MSLDIPSYRTSEWPGLGSRRPPDTGRSACEFNVKAQAVFPSFVSRTRACTSSRRLRETRGFKLACRMKSNPEESNFQQIHLR